MNIFGVIPARMSATRFPDKPLAKIMGLPMIGHVYLRAKLCENLSDVYVATCDQEIYDFIESIGGKAIMTKDTHERATDRTSEAFEKIIRIDDQAFDGVLMIQGDEPLLNPEILDRMISFHVNQAKSSITNLVSQIHSLAEFNNTNVVKAVMNKNGRILYFSRSPIPSNAKYNGKLTMWKQLGLILFSGEALREYSNLHPTELEIIESVDMNRLLENDIIIQSFPTSEVSQAVDIPEDIGVVETMMENDRLVSEYMKNVI
jgi:3-deoxy-manno-octulosonate cytidylyltransferase (CMP-KDO synthetase)